LEGETTTYYLEYRVAGNGDAHRSPEVVLYVVDGGQISDTLNLTSGNVVRTELRDLLTVSAGRFVDHGAGLEIEVVRAWDSAADLEISFDPAACVRGSPRLEIRPEETIYSEPGSSMRYSVKVASRDSRNCGPAVRNFDLQAPGDWTVEQTFETVTLAPYETAQVDATVTITPNQDPGFQLLEWRMEGHALVDRRLSAWSFVLPAPEEPGEPDGEEPPADLPYLGLYYGNAAIGYGVGNTNLTYSDERAVSHFFYAERTGTITHFRWQRRTGSGYSGGDGGVYTVEIRAADPSTRLPRTGVPALCQLNNYKPGNPGAGQAFVTVAFAKTCYVDARDPIALIFRNTHAEPHSNYVAQNTNAIALHGNGNPLPPPSGTDPQDVGDSPVAVSGWTPVWIDGTEWYPWPTVARNGQYRYPGTPLVSVGYSDGVWAGFLFTAAEPAYKTEISGDKKMYRDRFRVTRASRTVDGVFIRIPRYNGSTGELVVSIEESFIEQADASGNGTVIIQASIPASILTDVGSDEYREDLVNWIWVPFSERILFEEGRIYNIRLSAAGGLVTKMFTNKRADSYFAPRASGLSWSEWADQRTVDWQGFEDSRGGQATTNGGASWSYVTGGLSPILFRVVQ
jgi:hypothetical protein